MWKSGRKRNEIFCTTPFHIYGWTAGGGGGLRMGGKTSRYQDSGTNVTCDLTEAQWKSGVSFLKLTDHVGTFCGDSPSTPIIQPKILHSSFFFGTVLDLDSSVIPSEQRWLSSSWCQDGVVFLLKNDRKNQECPFGWELSFSFALSGPGSTSWRFLEHEKLLENIPGLVIKCAPVASYFLQQVRI